MPRVFDPKELQNLKKRSELPENGEITIIGGSDLFHGAPVLSLRAASRIVDMVYFSSPDPSMSEVALQLKSQLSSFIWVPWEEIGDYVNKSGAVLIGPGMKRYHAEGEREKYEEGDVEEYDQAGTQTKFVVEKLLRQFPDKQWVIDGGALQVVNPQILPKGSIITPNQKEFSLLFQAPSIVGEQDIDVLTTMITLPFDHSMFKGTVVLKGPTTIVASNNPREEIILVEGGNSGLTKGGTGDTLAGLTVALASQNDPILAAAAASWAIKRAADDLHQEVGTVYNSDDLANRVAEVVGEYLR